MINLAGTLYGDDLKAMREAINPQTAEAKLALARYFAKHDELTESLDLLCAAGNEAAEVQRRELLNELLEQHRFGEGYQVWLSGHEAAPEDIQNHEAGLNDGGFERLSLTTETGFGWRVGDEAETFAKASLDPDKPHAGEHCLRLDWGGDSHPALPIVSQLAIVEPGHRYRLTFAARTVDLVSGGLPFVVAVDADSKDGALLGQSSLLTRDTNGWRNYTVEFATGEKTTAVAIILRRQCETMPCPIYGHAWLDDFSLRKL